MNASAKSTKKTAAHSSGTVFALRDSSSPGAHTVQANSRYQSTTDCLDNPLGILWDDVPGFRIQSRIVHGQRRIATGYRTESERRASYQRAAARYDSSPWVLTPDQ